MTPEELQAIKNSLADATQSRTHVMFTDAGGTIYIGARKIANMLDLISEIERLQADLASETAWAEQYQNQVNRLLDDCIMWQQKLAEAKTEIDRLKLERSK